MFQISSELLERKEKSKNASIYKRKLFYLSGRDGLTAGLIDSRMFVSVF